MTDTERALKTKIKDHSIDSSAAGHHVGFHRVGLTSFTNIIHNIWHIHIWV